MTFNLRNDIINIHPCTESMGPLAVSIAKVKKKESWLVKPKKVKCTGCSKSFKDDSVLQHHSIYCTKIKQSKPKKPPSPVKVSQYLLDHGCILLFNRDCLIFRLAG